MRNPIEIIRNMAMQLRIQLTHNEFLAKPVLREAKGLEMKRSEIRVEELPPKISKPA
jgi:hypothetical protein